MGRNSIITIEDINNITDNGRLVFEKEIGKFSTTQNISSPLRVGDSNPSFRIYQNNSFIWSFKDYGGQQKCGSYITFIQELYGLNFQQCLDKIWKDFNGNNTKFTKKIIEKPKEIKKEPLLFEFNDCRFTDNHKRYMDDYQLDEEYLNSRDVWAVDKWAINKKIVHKTSGEYNFAYVHKDKDGKETGKLKILSLGKNVDVKHKWKTTVPNHWLWYTHLINDECKDLWIVKSVKDANVLHKHFNLCSISVQNESSQILLENNYDYLESINKRKIVNFGTDFQGWHESYVITYLTDWSYFNVPNSTYDHFKLEDVSDYVKYFGVNSLRTLLKQKNYL